MRVIFNQEKATRRAEETEDEKKHPSGLYGASTVSKQKGGRPKHGVQAKRHLTSVSNNQHGQRIETKEHSWRWRGESQRSARPRYMPNPTLVARSGHAIQALD